MVRIGTRVTAGRGDVCRIDAEARDRNFAVHLPVIDRLFGTHHLPAGRWPAAYGVPDETVPAGWLAQLAWPLGRRRA